MPADENPLLDIQPSPLLESAEHFPVLGPDLRLVLDKQKPMPQGTDSANRHERTRDVSYLEDALDQVRCTANLGFHVEVHLSLIWHFGSIAHDVLLIVIAAR